MPVTGFVSSRSRVGPDPILVREQLLHLQNLVSLYGAALFCEQFFWILRKKEDPEEGISIQLPNENWNRRLVPFRLNEVQLDIESRMGPRNICLKYRQGGYTTFFIIRRLYLPAILEPGAGSLLISQTSSYAAKHFDMLKRAHRYCGAVDPFLADRNELSRQLHENLLHTAYSSRRELVFDQIDSRILCDSAEVEEVGQGLTLHHVVGTEVARWSGLPEETLANLKEAIADGGTLDLESTANGMGGYFYEECMRARDPNVEHKEFTYFFHEWWWNRAYRDVEAVPESKLTEEEQLLRTRFQLDLHQLLWRRKKYVSLRHNFPEKYPEDDITCFLLSGSQYFDRDVLRHRLIELQGFKPAARARGGDLVIFHNRVKGREYIIGADPARGVKVTTEDRDFCAAVVLDALTGEEMAALRLRVPPEDFAYDLAELGRLYNNALIAVERNDSGGTVILTLQIQCGYSNLYEHREWTKKDREKLVVDVLGFPTTPKTRPIALNIVGRFVREAPELIWDIQFVREALTFVRDEKGKPETAEGSHDDTVSARWVAHYVRLVRLGYFDPTRVESEKYEFAPAPDVSVPA